MGEQTPVLANLRRGETAAEAAVADVPRAAPGVSARELRAALVGQLYASATEIAVLEGERLVGIVPIEQLLASTDETPLSELVVDVVAVPPELDLETATRGPRTVVSAASLW